MMKGRMRFCLPTVTIFVAVALSAGTAASNAGEASTPQQVFDGMRESFKADKAKAVHARYQWELSGPQGGEWWIDVTMGPSRWEKERSAIPRSPLSPAIRIGSQCRM